MTEVYRKRGRVVRWENGTVVRAVESGLALDDGELFRCYPEPAPALEQLAPDRVVATADAIRELAGAHPIERLIVTAGEAEHDCDGRRWTDRSERIHLALRRGRIRVLIDLASFALEDIARIAAVLDRLDDDAERAAPPQLRLAPNVTAALLPHLAAAAHPNVVFRQRAGGIDGKGFPITDATTEWPNWYRPSYRFRPVRMPLNLEARCGVTAVDPSLPVAAALIAPVDGATLRVLVDDGERVRPATVQLDAVPRVPRVPRSSSGVALPRSPEEPEEPRNRIHAIGAPAAFYPYGAGSFGAEMVL